MDLYDRSKKNIFENYSFIEEMMKKLHVPKFIEGIAKEDVKNIIKYVNSNKYDYKEIKIEDCPTKEKHLLVKINSELKKMDIYTRIKFNLTFERDLEIVEFYNELKKYIALIESADNFKKSINEYKKIFKEKYHKLQEEFKLVSDRIIAFDYSKVFHEISAKEFAEFFSNQFKNVKIDLLGKESNNIFLYIFLLKKNIFHEMAFKTTEGINDE